MMSPTDEIEPLVPELPRQMLTDRGYRQPHHTQKTFDDAENDSPLVPDLS